MRLGRLLVLLLVAGLLAMPARAGIFGKKKPKPDPLQRVPELLGIVKNSQDESERSDAAEELRKYEPQQFPDIVPALISVLQTDPKPGVRIQAISTLAKLRPVSQEVGMAIEEALAKDSSMRVRIQARSSLMSYHWAGYRTPKKDEKSPTTKEPPLAPPVPEPTPSPPEKGMKKKGMATPPAPQPLPPNLEPDPPPAVSGPIIPQRMPLGPSVPPKIIEPVKPKEGPDLGSPY